MTAVVRWGSYGRFSGPFVRGTCRYAIPNNPTDFDLVVAAVSEPEGGCYNSVFMADGTAVTFGLLQWTFTSGRLQQLLGSLYEVSHWRYDKQIMPMLALLGVRLEKRPTLGWVLADNDGAVVSGKDKLRNIFTAPNGKVPRSGKGWEVSRAVAEVFAEYGTSESLWPAQIDFALTEFWRESQKRRPQLGGKTIASVLPDGDGFFEVIEEAGPSAAIHALFWALWQNGPREAERILRIAMSKKNPKLALARLAARSSYGNWGLEKAKANGRTARYTKIARVVNRVLGSDVLPMNP